METHGTPSSRSPSWRSEILSESGKSPSAKKPERMFPTIIDMTSNSISTPYKEKLDERHAPHIRKPQATMKDILTVSISHRLAARKQIHRRLSVITDVMCVISVLSLILMVTANEITFSQISDLDTPGSWFIKLVISLSTVVLLALVLVYHRLDLALYSVNNSVEDWRVGLTHRKAIMVLIELIVCAVHPMPRLYPSKSRIAEEEARANSTYPIINPYSYVSPGVALGLPMFLRLYLFSRFVIYHSQLARSSATQSLGYLNQVSMDFPFLLRTYLDQWPGRSLLALSILVFFIGSWGLRACGYRTNNEHITVADAIWLFSVTFTTLGYGDLYPSTYCGRAVAIFITLFGILVSSLFIAVLAQKLVLERPEKYVHSFVSSTKLASKRKEQASNIIKYAILLWIWSRKEKPHALHYLRTQQKLFRAINLAQEIKKAQKRSIDNCVSHIEIITMQRTANEKVDAINGDMNSMKLKVEKIEEQFVYVKNSMDNIQNTLNILVDTMKSGTRL